MARTVSAWYALPTETFSPHDRLLISGCGVRSAVPLALAVSIAEELPHLRGIPAGTAEFVGQHLLTLLFMVVIADLIMQTLLMRRWVASQQNS